MTRLRIVDKDHIVRTHREPVDARARDVAAEIVGDVRANGAEAVRRYAERFDGLMPSETLLLERDELDAASDRIDSSTREALERAASRIRSFASAQRETIAAMEMTAHGAAMGQTLHAMERAGCYAPGGRYPLPSSVLMTAIPARVAGVERVIVASPRPSDVMLAAASIAGADAVLRVGGAQAIAALAFGVRDDALAPGAVGSIAAAGPLVEPVDVIVGPGNAYVTAAKQLVSGAVAIDMLAGPSELVVIADASADAETVAADLLAQSEHDVMASAVLIATDADLVERVNDALERQLDALPTRDTARASIEANGMAVVADDLDDAATLSDRLAPEHLEILASPDVAERVAARIRHAGAVFIGDGAAEVFGDYGLGPNHTLPTGGTARSFAGLSVHTFLRTRTFIRAAGELDPVAVRDTVTLARVEGLEGHARSGERRM